MEISGSLEYCINIVLYPKDIRYSKRGMGGRIPQVEHRLVCFLLWKVFFIETSTELLAT